MCSVGHFGKSRKGRGWQDKIKYLPKITDIALNYNSSSATNTDKFSFRERTRSA